MHDTSPPPRFNRPGDYHPQRSGAITPYGTAETTGTVRTPAEIALWPGRKEAETVSQEQLVELRRQFDEACIERMQRGDAETTQALQVEVERVRGAVAVRMHEVPLAMFNNVILFGEREPATRQTVEALMSFYGPIPFQVHVNPGSQPAGAVRWLREAGLRPESPQAVWLHDLTTTPSRSTALRVERVSYKDAEHLAHVFDQVYGPLPSLAVQSFVSGSRAPGMHSYVAYDGDVPVAAARMLVVGEMAHFRGAATLPHARNRGAQSALLELRLHDAAELGCRLATMETYARPNASARNVERAGFRRIYDKQVFRSGRVKTHPFGRFMTPFRGSFGPTSPQGA